MKTRSCNLICLSLMAAVASSAASLPCLKPGTERWPVKISLAKDPGAKSMSLADVLNLPKLDDVAKNDKRYPSTRIPSKPVTEGTLVTLSGWLYLVAFESDDCDFHIQISPQPRTATDKPTADDNCIIVEAPSGQYATTITEKVEEVRQWVIDNLLGKVGPKIGSVHVMSHPVYVTVTGALFYDDAHEYLSNGGTGRGKKGMESKTLWELHPLTKIAFAAKPATATKP